MCALQVTTDTRGLNDELLVLQGVPTEPGGYTPFHLEAMYGRSDVFQTLLSSHPGVIGSGDGSTVLRVAVQAKQVSFIESLEYSVFDFDVNAQDPKGRTPLMLAIRDREEVLTRLCSSYVGVNCNTQDGQERFLLHYCASINDLNYWKFSEVQKWDAILEMLRSTIHHANVGFCDDKGTSVFMAACSAGFKGTVKHLLDSFDPSFSHQAP